MLFSRPSQWRERMLGIVDRERSEAKEQLE
jgi:hypothetical protein